MAIPPSDDNSTGTPIDGPACAYGNTPCENGAEIPAVGDAICLSGADSPFGGVFDILVGCGQNGTESVWSLCAGTDKVGCGDCSCTCRMDAALTAYANNVITSAQLLRPEGVCLESHFLPGSVNPVNLLLGCRAC